MFLSLTMSRRMSAYFLTEKMMPIAVLNETDVFSLTPFCGEDR